MSKTPRQLQKEQTRQRILAAAFFEFASQGIMSTTMSDVANRAKVSHGTVFAHFATQEILINSVIEEFGEKVTLRIHELSDRMGSVNEALQAHLTGLIDFENFYTRLIIEARFLPQIAQDTLLSIQSAISFHLSHAAAREMDLRKIKPMPFYLLFNTWMGLIHYYMINSNLFAPQSSVLSQYGDLLIEHFMKLISN